MRISKFQERIRDFNKNGFCVFDNFISLKKINKLSESLVKLFAAEIGLNIKDKIKIDDKEFHSLLLKFRKNNPSGFSYVYNAVKGNPYLISILNDPKIFYLASLVLKTKINYLWNGEFQLRMDCPYDNRNSLGWHQDANYYLDKTTTGSNGLVMWVAISKKIKKINGALMVCPKSHENSIVLTKKKILKSKKYSNNLKSVTRSIDSKLIKKYKQQTIETKRGDLILMDLRTFHRSGLNKSNQVRFSTINRIFNTQSKEWIR